MATVIKNVKLPAKNESECDKIIKNALKNYPYALNSFGETAFCGDESENSECAGVAANCGGNKSDCNGLCSNALNSTERAVAKTEIRFVCSGKAEIKTEVAGFFKEDKNKKLATEIAKSIKKEIINYCRELSEKKVKNPR